MRRFTGICLLLALLFSLIGCKKEASVSDSDILIFEMERSQRGVEEFLALSGREGEDDWYNVTPEEIEETCGFAIYRWEPLHESFLVYQGGYYLLGDFFGGLGANSFAIADLNQDGFWELFFTYSWGSGLHRSHVGYFDSATQAVMVFTQHFPNTDLFLFCDNGLTVCRVNADSHYDPEVTQTPEVGQLIYANGKICFALEDGTQSDCVLFCKGFPPADHWPYSTFLPGATQPRSAFVSLEPGTSVASVTELDPLGEYTFLYTGRNDVPRVSHHYTTDGYHVAIWYDEDQNLCEVIYDAIA